MLKIQKNPSIREQVLEQMRELIISNAIPSGDRLYEEKLAAELGVSRTPVREALHALEREGFLESIPRVGYMVKTPSLDEFEEIIEIRKALEALTAIWAAHRLDKAIMDEIQDNLDQSAKAVNKNKIDKFMELNEEYHEIIDRASGKQRICEMNRNLRAYIYFFRIRESLDKKLVQKALDDHIKLFKAMKNKDEDTIRKVVDLHMEGIKENFLSSNIIAEEKPDK